MDLNCIVVVDSDEISHFILKKHFKDFGVSSEIRYFKDVEDGINFLYDFSLRNNDCCPERIFIDLNLNMAGKDGYYFLEIFRHMKFANKRKVKLAVLSDFYPEYIRGMKGKLKFKILLKPITKVQLIPMLQKVKEKINC